MLNREDKAGLYITVIFHLLVVIVLLASQIGFSLQRENSFVIDFSKQEEIQRREAKKAFDEDIQKRVEDLIAGASDVDFRNVTSSRNNSALKDDRNTDADKLYEDADRLAKDLKNGPKDKAEDNFVEVPTEKAPKKEEKERSYSGPSVLSWHLEGRKATHLPIPAYRCYGGGMVTVLITVNSKGAVIDAKIQEETSSDDTCLRNFAIRAARGSRFSISPDKAKQTGDIVYQFIAQ